MNAVTVSDPAQLLEQVVLHGDLSRMNPQQRVTYYAKVCESLGLNPLTRPFEYMKLNGKEVLYAKRDAADQLRKLHCVSITGIRTEQIKDVYVVTATAACGDRTDSATGAVATGTLSGDLLANALMKAETKAKRRVTLSICGLGWLDETELETIKETKPQGSLRDRVMQQVKVVDPEPSCIVALAGDAAPATFTPNQDGAVTEAVPASAEPAPPQAPPVAAGVPEWLTQPHCTGLITEITQAAKPTKAGRPWGTMTIGNVLFEGNESLDVVCNWFAFPEPWDFESIQMCVCNTDRLIHFTTKASNNPKYPKPTLEHFFVEPLP